MEHPGQRAAGHGLTRCHSAGVEVVWQAEEGHWAS